MLDELKTQHKVVGIKQLRKALKDGRIVLAFIAENADPQLTQPIEQACDCANVEIVRVPTMIELGKACGICVGAAAAGILT